MRGCHQLRKSWWSHHCEDVISLVKSWGVNHSGGISAGEVSQWARTITRSKAISACEDVISWKTWWPLCEGISSLREGKGVLIACEDGVCSPGWEARTS